MKQQISKYQGILIRLIITAIMASALISCGGGGDEDGGGSNNTPPIADAGKEVNSSDLTIVTLDGVNSIDSDGSIDSFIWTQIENGAPNVTIESQKGSQITLNIPDVAEKTTFIFELRVVDNHGGEDTDEVTIHVIDVNCEDDIESISNTGVFITSASGDFVPRCNSEVYISNQLLNQVELRNIYTGELIRSYQLTSAPTDLEYDNETGKLYVALSGATFFAVIDKNNETLDYIQSDDIVYHISSGKDGDVYLSTGSDYRKNLYKMDSTYVFSGPWYIGGGAIRYNKNSNQIVTATIGLSPATIVRYGFDYLGELVELQRLRTGGGNGQDLALSNDGKSVALAAGGGNGPGYTIYNYSSEDLSVIYGEWNTGAYPSGVAFSPDDSLVVATNRSELVIFDAAFHTELIRESIPSCSYGDLSKVGFSAGGALGFVKQTCGFDNDIVKLFYFKITSN